MKEIFYKQYVFLEYINDLIKENLKKFKNLSIIINIDKKDEENIKNECSIVKFAKKNKIPFMLKNNFQKCIKYNANGIFINSTNKKIIKPILLKKNFWIIGGTHNQMEYSKKIDQKCNMIILSPLFYNAKYSKNKILGINKFNLLSLNWNIQISALGGLNKHNIHKLKFTKCIGYGFKSSIENSQQ